MKININTSGKILNISGICLIIMALVCTGAVLYIIINSQSDLPEWAEWENVRLVDSSGQYEISLNRKSVNITYDNNIIWTSPDDVKVQQVLSCDIDNDSEDELILLCWKKGHFGSHKPFWLAEESVEDDEWSQHIFVYEYGRDVDMADETEMKKISESGIMPLAAPGEIRPKWMSSYIGQDVADIASNGKEAPLCRLLLTSPDGQVSSWVWASWGFTKESDISLIIFDDKPRPYIQPILYTDFNENSFASPSRISTRFSPGFISKELSDSFTSLSTPSIQTFLA